MTSKNEKRNLLVIICASIILQMLIMISCSQEQEAPQPQYYGSVWIAQAGVPDARDLDVYFNGDNKGVVSGGGGNWIHQMIAEKPITISLYKAGSDTLVADTTLSITRNTTATLKVISSDLLKTSGFIGRSSVGADSVNLQFINTLDPALYPHPVINLVIYTYKSNKGDSLTTVKGIHYNALHPVSITLPHVKDGAGITYACKFIDASTGEFFSHTANAPTISYSSLITNSTSYNGHKVLVQFYDNGWEVTTNRILSRSIILD